MKLVSQERLQEIGGPAELNMAPLIDMVFILLIFFLVTTTFVRQTGLDVERPSARTATELEAAHVLIGIDARGAYSLQSRPVSLLELQGLLRQEHALDADRAVVIAADHASTHAALVAAMDAARLAGFTRLALATEKTE